MLKERKKKDLKINFQQKTWNQIKINEELIFQQAVNLDSAAAALELCFAYSINNHLRVEALSYLCSDQLAGRRSAVLWVHQPRKLNKWINTDWSTVTVASVFRVD